MSFDSAIALVASVATVAYLFVALLRPEQF